MPGFVHFSDQEYARVAGQLRASPNEDDATTFMYACNLETVWCVVYRREGDVYVKDEEEMNRFLDNI